MSAESTTCTLTVTIPRAEGLKDTATFGKQDPFFKIQCSGQNFRGPTHDDGGVNPVWNDKTYSFSFFNRTALDDSDLYISVYNENSFGNEKIGRNAYPCKDLIEDAGEEKAYPLLDPKGKPRGNVFITVNYHDPVEEAEKAAAEAARQEELRAAAEAAAEAARVEAEARAAEIAAAVAAENEAQIAALKAAMAEAQAKAEAEAEERRVAEEAAAAERAAREAAVAAAAAEAARIEEEQAAAAAREAARPPPPYTRCFVGEPVVRDDEHTFAECAIPAGWKQLGGGAKIEYEGAGGLLVSSKPHPAIFGWYASGQSHKEDDKITMTAYCIAIKDPEDRYETCNFSDISETGSHPEASVSLPEGEGWVLTGGGADAQEGEGPGSFMVSCYPKGSAFVAQYKDHLEPSPAKCRVWAIGLRAREGTPPLEWDAVMEVQSPKEGGRVDGDVKVGENVAVCGGGAFITFKGPGVMMVASHPVIKGEPDEDGGYEIAGWQAAAKDHLEPDSGEFTVFACGVRSKLEDE